MADQSRASSVGRFRRTAALSESLLLLALTAVIFAVMASVLPRQFLNPYNLQSMMFTAPELGILGLAMMISMISGGIDLSLVAIANLSAVAAGLFFHAVAAHWGIRPTALGLGVAFAGMGVAVAVGILAGTVNGILVSQFGITPLLATIGSSQVYFGVSLTLTGGPAVEGFPDAWQSLGQGIVSSVPIPAIVMIGVFLAAAALLHRTAAGSSLPLIGVNDKAALFSGIRINRMLFLTFAVTGAMASVAGILLSARTNAAKADYGGSYLLVSVLVAVLAGADPGGGKVRIVGVAAALTALTFLSSGFQMLRFSNFLVEMIWGCFLIGLLAIYRFRRGNGRAVA